MNRKAGFFMVAAALVMIGGIGLTAQTSVDAVPSPPYLGDLPPNAQWTVTAEDKNLSGSGGATVAPATPLVTRVTTFPEGRHDVITLATGDMQDRWFTEGCQITRTIGKDDVIIRTLDPNPTKDWPHTLNLTELAWIETTKPVSLSFFKGQAALYFAAEVPAPVLMQAGMAPDLVSTVKMEAWIDPKTKLPLAFNDGIQTYSYTFMSASGERFSLPPDIADRLQKYIRRSKALY